MQKIILTILLIIWMITIFYFSSEQGEKSGNTSGEVINKIINIFYKKANKAEKANLIKKLQLPIRKLAHFTIYLIGGVLAILLLNTYNINLIQKIAYSQTFITIYAISDEFHQRFVPGRTATITDVLIDSAGGLMAIVLISMMFLRK